MITVRAIESHDREIWEKLFTEYGVFYETAFSHEVLEGVWAWLMHPSHPVDALVATTRDGVIGFAIYRHLFDTFTAGSSWFLDDLYVSPEARGAGAATALIAAVEANARENGGGTLRWITAENNHTAQRVYDRVANRTTWVTYEKETN